MAYIYIDTAKAISSSQDILNTAKRLKELRADLDQISLDRILDSASRKRIDEALQTLRTNVSTEAARMGSLGEALQTIAKAYRDAEKTIVGNVGDIEKVSLSAEQGTDKRNLWNKFWDWLTRNEPDEYDTTTREQERAADEAMKRDLWNVLQDEKYSQESWDKASVEERKRILQDYMDEVIRIYGLEDVKPQINWDSSATYTSESITWGYYNHGRHSVTLNEQALSDSIGNWDSYDLLETVSHELRHAYQHEAVDHPTRYMVSQETIDTWKDNFRNYIGSDDYERYRAQPVEVDARDFQVSRDDPAYAGASTPSTSARSRYR